MITKFCGFRKLNPSPEEHEKILDVLYMRKNMFEKPEHIMVNNNHEMLKVPEEKNNEDFILYNWHIDYPPEEARKDDGTYGLCAYIALHMHTFNCSPDVGQTIFLSLVDLYNRCPEKFKQELEYTEFVALRGVGQNESVFSKTYKAIRNHPITKEKILFWGAGFAPSVLNIRTGKYESPDISGQKKPMVTTSLEEPAWFKEFSSWVFDELQNKSNWAVWSWSKNDFIIWDNRALLHTFSGGWDKKDRIFSRSNIGNEVFS